MDSEDPPPLSDQLVATHDARRSTVLAPSVFKYWLVIGGSSWVLTLALMTFDSRALGFRALLFSCIAPTLAYPLAGAIRSMFALVVSDHGTTGRTSRGQRVTVTWSDPHSIRVRRSVGLLHIEISSPREPKPIQIAVFKIDPKELIAAVERHSGSQAMVTRYEEALHAIRRTGA